MWSLGVSLYAMSVTMKSQIKATNLIIETKLRIICAGSLVGCPLMCRRTDRDDQQEIHGRDQQGVSGGAI